MTRATPAPTPATTARRRAGLALLLLGTVALLGGCQNRNLAGSLRSAGIGGAPDEFMVLPTKPLEMPGDLAALPVPAPGTTNLVDYEPRAEAVAGLSGKPTLATADGSGLLARSGPGAPGIRAELATEDVQYRADNRGLLLERAFARDKDALIYRRMTLAQAQEYERIRAAGIGVPAAPPALLAEE